jgi:molybdopterin converting factor small subunit
MLGVLQEINRDKVTFVDVPEKSTVGSAILKIINDNMNLKKILWDNQVNSPSPNALIILDGIEINNLRGLETKIVANQELVMLPVVHGG